MFLGDDICQDNISVILMSNDRIGIFTIVAFCFCLSLCPDLELIRERNVVEEHPGIVELMVPRSLEILHCLDHPWKLIISNQRK